MIHTVNSIDIEDYYGNSQDRIELHIPIEIDSKDISILHFVFADIQKEPSGKTLRIQFDGEENGYYEFDDVDESADELFNYILEMTDDDVDEETRQQIRDAMINIMKAE